jgi:hypothetical protein
VLVGLNCRFLCSDDPCSIRSKIKKIFTSCDNQRNRNCNIENIFPDARALYLKVIGALPKKAEPFQALPFIGKASHNEVINWGTFLYKKIIFIIM